MDIKQMQKEIFQNKRDKNFNVTDVNKEFCLLYGEIAEAYDAYRNNKQNLGEELADVAIYLFSIAEMLNKDLQQEIIDKMVVNKNRSYVNINGVNKKV